MENDDLYEDNDTLFTAFDLSGRSGVPLSAFLGLATALDGDDDYYRIDIAQAGVLQVDLAFLHSDADLDLTLFDDFGSILADSISETDDETIVFNVGSPGEYIVRVDHFVSADGSGTYDLVYTFTPGAVIATDDYEENDAIGDAFDLSGQSGVALSSISGLASVEAGDLDYYGFSVAGFQTVQIDLAFEHSDADIDLRLLGESGEVLSASESDTDDETIILASLAQGDYVIEVSLFESSDGAGTYDLTYTLADLDEGTPFGDVFNGDETPNNYVGLAGDDVIRGFGGDDVLDGGADGDVVRGAAGEDVVEGGDGDDIVSGDAGADLVTGGDGADVVRGGADDDTVSGGDGDDVVVSGDRGNDIVDGGAGDDRVRGGAGDDFVFGGDGDDRVIGDRGNDLLVGDVGDDTLVGGLGDDFLLGGEGDDVLVGDTPVQRQTDRGTDVFIFEIGGGVDIVRDFEQARDLLDVSEFAFGSFDELQSAMTTLANGVDTRIALGETEAAIIRGVTADQLVQDDFIVF